MDIIQDRILDRLLLPGPEKIFDKVTFIRLLRKLKKIGGVMGAWKATESDRKSIWRQDR